MKERPILFAPAMVTAILEGRKTQTRRIVKPAQSFPKALPLTLEPWIINGVQDSLNGIPLYIGTHPEYPTGEKYFGCPYGTVGDRLWVREDWRPLNWGAWGIDFDWMTIEFKDGAIKKINPFEAWGDRTENVWARLASAASYPVAWRPSIHMPRTASRILLEIVDVRVERLKSISDEDAIEEGARCFSDLPSMGHFDRDTIWSLENPKSREDCLGSAKYAFANYWNKLAKEGTDWHSNPWVWVIEFRFLSK